MCPMSQSRYSPVVHGNDHIREDTDSAAHGRSYARAGLSWRSPVEKTHARAGETQKEQYQEGAVMK